MGACKECKVLREWNEELRNDRDKLQYLLNEKEIIHTVSDNSSQTLLDPIRTTTTPWRATRRRLERKYAEIAKDKKNPVQVVEN